MTAPIVIVAPADFASDTRLAAFQAWSQITTRNVDAALRTCLRGAVREAESVMCRAVLRQEREQLHPPGGYRDVLLLGEPFHGTPTVVEVDASGVEGDPLVLPDAALQHAHGRIYHDNWDTDAVWRRVRFEAGWDGVEGEPEKIGPAPEDGQPDNREDNPLHVGDGETAVPPDVVQGIYSIAAATWNRRPALADAARDHLRARYRLAGSGWLTTGV